MRPRLGFVGPHLGRHPGWVTTQSEVLSELFLRHGYTVRVASSVKQPWLRLADTLARVAGWRRRVDLVVLSVFSGRAFGVAELVSRWTAVLGLPQVHWLHGGDLPQLAHDEPERLRRVLGRADAVVAPSPYLARTAREMRVEAEVIPNVLDLDAYELRHRPAVGEPLRLLWMRTFHPLYRPQLAIETLALLRAEGLDARLTLAGQDKGLLDACCRRVDALGLGAAVAFPGFLDAAAKRRAFAEHDVFLSTNQVDNTPVTVLEAAASGLPIVAVAAGGIPDLLRDGETALLVEESGSGNAAALAAAVRRLQAEPVTVARLSSSGRGLAERSAWPAVHARWSELFRRLGLG